MVETFIFIMFTSQCSDVNVMLVTVTVLIIAVLSLFKTACFNFYGKTFGSAKTKI